MLSRHENLSCLMFYRTLCVLSLGLNNYCILNNLQNFLLHLTFYILRDPINSNLLSLSVYKSFMRPCVLSQDVNTIICNQTIIETEISALDWRRTHDLKAN